MNRIIPILTAFLLSIAGQAYSDGFRAEQTRFFGNVIQAVDVELSRFGSYLALADRTEGNSLRVYDDNGELLWRHRQPLYWAGTFKKAGFLQFAPGRSLSRFSGL